VIRRSNRSIDGRAAAGAVGLYAGASERRDRGRLASAWRDQDDE
jgi:hypothetical protein